MTTATALAQTIGIATAFLASGSIATTSLIDISELQAQPASRSLPSIRWYFSRGSHIFPQAAALSSAAFAYLAYTALPPAQDGIAELIKAGSKTPTVNGYIAAALLSISIAPWTVLVMVPTNFSLIQMNEDLGGARSSESAKQIGRAVKPGKRNAEDSVNSEGDINEFTDLSGPQTRTQRESTKEEDERARELLARFGRLNAVRAALLGVGGVVGLLTALTP